jgi:hypothetical protein
MRWGHKDGTRTFCEVKLSSAIQEGPPRRGTSTSYATSIFRAWRASDRDKTRQRFGIAQILRNIWRMVGANDGQLVFLIPRANTTLWPILPGVVSRVSVRVRDQFALSNRGHAR